MDKLLVLFLLHHRKGCLVDIEDGLHVLLSLCVIQFTLLWGQGKIGSPVDDIVLVVLVDKLIPVIPVVWQSFLLAPDADALPLGGSKRGVDIRPVAVGIGVQGHHHAIEGADLGVLGQEGRSLLAVFVHPDTVTL